MMGPDTSGGFRSLADSVYAQSRRTPDAVAIIDHDTRVDYASLGALAYSVELALQRAGVHPGQAVAVILPRSWQLVAVMLGVLRLGAQVVPLDPNSPLDRYRHILTDSAATALIFDESAPVLQPGPGSIMHLPVSALLDRSAKAAGAAIAAGAPHSPAEASFLFYTSGTTGKPKGVQVRDAGILRLAMPGYIDICGGERFSWMSNPAFDALSFEVWTPLMTGGSCVVVPDEVVATPDLLEEMIRRERIDTTWVTAALFNVIVDTAPRCFASVGQLLVGGEQLDPDMIRRWYVNNPQSKTVIYNGYGPTESTTFALCGAIPRGFSDRIVPIGRPLPRTKALLVVPGLERVAAVDEVGELLLAGDGIAAGYQNLPDETATRFVTLPWFDGGRERFYRSGDLARADADGLVTFVGRLDRQVKVRGFRIEPGEIESQLTVHPSVRRAHVCARRNDDRGITELLAYLVIGSALSFDDFEFHLARTLPTYMRPHHIYVVDEFPLTPNGKVDEVALLRSDLQPWSRFHTDESTSEAERDVLALAEELLGLRPGRRDCWTSVGGDSLTALRFRFAIRQRWGVELSQSFVLQEEFERISAAISSSAPADISVYPTPTVQPATFATPATSEQQRLWLLQQRSPGARAYDVDLAFRIDGPVDVAALRLALQTVVRRRPALRTRFEATPEGIYQRVMDAYDPWIEPDRVPGSYFTEPFDLAQPEMLRASWAPDATGGVLLLRMHHIAVDGWSLNLIFEDLSTAYAGGSPQHGAEQFTMLDYAHWQADWFARDAYLNQRDDLRSFLDQHDGFAELPSGSTGSTGDPVKALLLQRSLDAVDAATVRRLCAELRVTRFQLLLALCALSVYAVTGESRPRFAAPVANRVLQEFEDTVGMMANTVLVPVEINPDENLQSQIARISETVRVVLDHEEVVLADVLSSQTAADRSFDYLFVLENTDFSALRLHDCRIEPLFRSGADAKCPITMTVVDHGGGLELLCEYAASRFTHAEVVAIADVFVHGLSLLDRSRTATPDELPRSHQRYGSEDCRGESAALTYQTIAEGFVHQVSLTPDAPALRSANGVVSYAELDAYAAALAEHLLAGYPAIERDGSCHVALYFQPSIEHVVALLALARLNVTAVPLDPAYPPTLLRRVITEVEPLCVLLGTDRQAEFGELGITGVCTEAVSLSALSSPRAVIATREVHPRRPLYTLFTSGSTGEPKGVEVHDRVLCNLIQWQQRSGGLTGAAVTQQFSMLSFDVSFQEIFTTLCSGGCLQLVQPEWRRDMPLLLERLESGGVERLFLPCVALQMLAEHGIQLGSYPSRLREVITAGEQLICSPAIRGWFAGLSGASLFNHYGPTETHVVTSLCLDGDPDRWPHRPAIGRPVANSVLRVVDSSGKSALPGAVGELLIGGLMAERCYLNAPQLNAHRFVESPDLFYRSGDLVSVDGDGVIQYVGRKDRQVKTSGYRLELEQVEAALLEHRGIAQAVVIQEDDQLVAYVRAAGGTPSFDELTTHLAALLPAYVRVDRFRHVAEFPLSPSGKLDRGPALTASGREIVRSGTTHVSASNLELQLCRVFEEVIGAPIGLDESFFDAGASSLGLMRFHLRCAQELGLPFSVADLFEHITVAKLARFLNEGAAGDRRAHRRKSSDEPIAVIGMAVRLPGAPDLAAFWDLVRTGRSGVQYFPAAPGLVGARSQLDGIFDFDPRHFGISPRDAAWMDPQQRHVLMNCVEALAHAGIAQPATHRVGMVASCGENTYFQAMLRETDPDLMPDSFQLALHHDKDFLATKAAYLLGLTGPAFTAQAACASSLVAVHLAAGMLRQGDADIMLVSAALIDPDLAAGYVYTPQHIFSRDGHCRAFSDDADGTFGGSGVATVVLKPLSAAQRDGDRIYSVITGSAINNDGSTKLSYSAPSPAGQRDVIRDALRRSGRTGRDIGYIEAHGTGTGLGDPVEVRALRQALDGAQPGQVALSTVKSQIGHLGAAAGIVGLIRATLGVYHGYLPPTADFQAPNPKFGSDWEPFHVPVTASEWPEGRERVAGVSSFGIGGTNAHVILEANYSPTSSASGVLPCLVLSSSSESALRADADRVADYLNLNPDSFHEVLLHLQVGRRPGRWRIAKACVEPGEAVAWLRSAPQPEVNEPSGDAISPIGLTSEQLAERWVAGQLIEWPGVSAPPPWDFPTPSFECASYKYDGVQRDRVQRSATLPLADPGSRLPEDDWLYQPTWVRCRRALSSASRSSRVLVIVTSDPLDAAVLETFRSTYARVIHVVAALTFARCGTDTFEMNPADPASIAALLAEVADELRAGVDWLHALPLSVTGPVGSGTLDQAQWACLDTPAALLQALSHTHARPRIVWLSSDARPVDSPVRRPELGLLAGVAMVAGYESAVSSSWLDLSGPDWQVWSAALVGLLGVESATLPIQSALRQGYWWEPNTTRVQRPSQPARADTPAVGGTHVVLGGTGGIGATIAASLLERGGEHVVLVARNSQIPEQLSSWIDRVTMIEADLAVSDPHAVAAMVGRHADRLVSVVHAVGVPAGGLIVRRDAAAARHCTAAKLAAAMVVELLIESHRPELAVYCSSMVTHFGSAGQLDYTAGNGALDSFAQFRATASESTLRIGINWDIWSESGMAAHVPHPDGRHRAHLAVGLSTAEGKRIFEHATRLQLPQLLVSTTELENAQAFYGAARSAAAAVDPSVPATAADFARRRDLAELLSAELRGALAVDSVDPQQCLYDLGADSLTLLELIDRIREVSGVGLELSELSHEVSLAEILSRIAAAADRSDEVTVEVWQEGAGRDVLCLIHPVGGDLQSYRALVTALPSELTVCLIADPGLRLPSPLRWTLDERARAYRAALESRFPSERWRIRLAGWSFGAWVAMGMAHHAESAGEHVDALYLLDPPASDAGVEITKFGPEELARVFQHELGQAGENQSGSSGYEYARRLAACCEANVHSMIGYRPPRLRATPSWVWLASRAVTDLPYFRPGPDSVATWQRLLPQLEELRTIDATHYEVVRPPHIEQIAGTIAETIGELV